MTPTRLREDGICYLCSEPVAHRDPDYCVVHMQAHRDALRTHWRVVKRDRKAAARSATRKETP